MLKLIRIKALMFCGIVFLFIAFQGLHAQETRYSLSAVLELRSSDEEGQFLFGYADYGTKRTYRGFNFWLSMPGPFFVDGDGEIYIYDGRGTVIKKYSGTGEYLDTYEIIRPFDHGIHQKGGNIDRNGNVAIRIMDDEIITFSTRSDNFKTLRVPAVQDRFLRLNKNGSLFAISTENRDAIKIGADGKTLGAVDYFMEDDAGHAYKIVGSESRNKERRHFDKSLEIYSGITAEAAAATNVLQFRNTISPNTIAPDTRWSIIGFDKDNNIYIQLNSKPDDDYLHGNPLIHILKYGGDGELLENIRETIPCTERNAPAGKLYYVDGEGTIYISAIQPLSEWKITKGDTYETKDFGDVDQLRFRIWKLQR